MAQGRLIVVAATDEIQGVLNYTLPKIRAYADRCNADMLVLSGLPERYQHGKYRIFELGDIDLNARRVLILDADVMPREDAPDIFEAYPSGSWMKNELAYLYSHVREHRRQLEQFLQDHGMPPCEWEKDVWWNPGVALLDRETVRAIYQMPPWDVREHTYRIGTGTCVKNMPWINYLIQSCGIEISPLDRRWNTFTSGTHQDVAGAHFWHFVCQQLPTDRNTIKEQLIQKTCATHRESLPERRVHFVMGAVQRGWILEKMQQEIIKRAPRDVTITSGDAPVDKHGVVNYYNPYRGYNRKSAHATDVVFCTHPELESHFYQAAHEADHVIVMCKKYRDEIIERGKLADQVTLIYPGVDEEFRDKRLRIFNPARMHASAAYAERKGANLWNALCKEPWIDAICSNGTLTRKQLLQEYRACDAVVSTALMEGGPMCVLEGLAIGKPVVAPEFVGLVDDLISHKSLKRYRAGNYDELLSCLRQLWQDKQNAGMSCFTWQAWAGEHWRVFSALAPAVFTKPDPLPNKNIPVFIGSATKTVGDAVQYIRAKGYEPVFTTARDGAIDLELCLGQPVLVRNRIIRTQLEKLKCSTQ